MTRGFLGKKMYVLAARPGQGKSALAMNFGVAAATAGFPVYLASLEMGRDELTDRMIATISGVPHERVTDMESATAEQWGKVQDASALLANLPMWIDDSADSSLSDIKAKVMRTDADAKRAGYSGVKLVVVDYLQLMREAVKAGRSREQAVSENSRGLKVLANELDIPVIVLAQMNRDVEKRSGPPKLSDLRESGSIEQDADVVMFLHRETKDGESNMGSGPTTLIIAKQRGGKTGPMPLVFNGDTMQFAMRDDMHEDAGAWGQYGGGKRTR
jgi:replicative DNA helicase